MRCINKYFTSIILAIVLATSLTGCAGMSYASRYSVTSYTSDDRSGYFYPTYASDLCVVNTDIGKDALNVGDKISAGLFDLNKKETIYAINVNEQVMPASLTKVMTAYVALKYGTLDQMLVAGSDVYVTESGAQKINLKEGDRMTLDQALHILLIYSANDVANLIASNVAGSIDEFVELMNKEAKAIGAVKSNFENPHGLTSENHYVTAYDMYLIFNAAMQYDIFNEIINMNSYTTSYVDSTGKAKDVNINSTNQYLVGNKQEPTGVTVIGGKTGTTNAAGHCLILLARDTASNPYIAIIMRDTSTDELYSHMSKMLSGIISR